jgi:hypothetical protein
VIPLVLVALGGPARPLASQMLRPVHAGVGLGEAVSDDAEGLSGSAGVAAYGRLTWWPADGISLLVDGWVHAVPTNHDIVTAPCPPSTSCGSSFTGATTSLILGPALQAREAYARVTLLYRVGPTVDWFVRRAPATDVTVLGVRAGFSVLTSRRATGLLFSIDYLRAFRDRGGPRWLLPLTIGWQF